METTRRWSALLIPNGWLEIVLRSIQVAVVAFIVLQLKEWFDAGMFDTPATASDSAMIAGGFFVLNAILRLAR